MELARIGIDLSSDTSTRPSPAMRRAMADAPVGDEQRGEDPTTLALEARVAALLGHEAAVFLPSGTMCNLIAFLVHCRPGDEVICAANTHVYGSEAAGAAALAGAQFRVIDTATGIFGVGDVEPLIRTPRARSPRSRAVVVEQTTNRGGGRIWLEETLISLAEMVRARGLALHMDGARLLNASVATGLAPARYAGICDSAWIDLSKGLGCPVGAVLAGTAGFIEEAWVWKHRLGGAMRQSGVLAAAGLYALDHNVERLAEDHAKARRLAAMLAEAGVGVMPKDDFTNILILDLPVEGPSAATVAEELLRDGIRFGVEGPFQMRAVTHLDVTGQEVERAGRALIAVLRGSA
ncbi:MAG: DegT/DnrJ/EryC1/StrS family aminotransferase [Proteobacteria bacterium]|nr:DegT/DnrJ/EryC1/StrS family aminotransferase [Pseudomonadota bacterium]